MTGPDETPTQAEPTPSTAEGDELLTEQNPEVYASETLGSEVPAEEDVSRFDEDDDPAANVGDEADLTPEETAADSEVVADE